MKPAREDIESLSRLPKTLCFFPTQADAVIDVVRCRSIFGSKK